FRFIATDAFAGSIVEAALDDFEIVVYQEPVSAVAAASGGDRLTLAPCRPNPFGGATSIRFFVPAPGRSVRLSVYDVAGRRVARLLDGEHVQGERTVSWDGRNDVGARVAGGVYLYRLEAGEERRSRKAVMLGR
ncbi:MAG TPA: FlgD immunoglobulin-like domain containing protein, partial [bacterium]|nr:FlgD immunoglobulin-like domain containing protein [bacterium]